MAEENKKLTDPGNTRLPGTSLLQYLPEIYRKKTQDRDSDFLERFLSIFAVLFDEIDHTISRIHDYFDPFTIPDSEKDRKKEKEFIYWLAQWLSLDLYELLGEKNKGLILNAFEFYRQKGTRAGIEALVSLLTGKKCCVKEYTNNVFRSYGMEHSGENEISSTDPKACKQLYRTTSKTVDTGNKDLLAKIHHHQGYEDQVHYVHDSHPGGKYTGNVIGLFIFINSSAQDFKIEEKLHRIIETFLPVFVRTKIFIVEGIDHYEEYPLNLIQEEDHVQDVRIESFPKLTGQYSDRGNWYLFYTNDKENVRTNNRLYRTNHSWINKELPW